MLTLFLLTGCGSWKRVSAENDKLRVERMELQKQVADLTERVTAAEKGLEIAKQQNGGSSSKLPEGVQTPITSRIEITRPTRGADTDNDGKDDAVRIYLETYDQRNRFVQSTATVSVTVAAVPAGKAAVTLATAEFDAKSFQDAYRSGFGGTHYTLLIPIPSTPTEGVDQLTLTLKLTDLLTGATHEAQKIVNFTRP